MATEWAERQLTGWGRYPVIKGQCARPERRSEVLGALADRRGDGVLAYGLGRSYGDAALLSEGRTVLMERLDRMLEFDPVTGWLRCEAGVSIRDLVDTWVPKGFFPPVVPGTTFVTVGGALANDIHGKNHHVAGSWADHVRRVEVLTADGQVVVCDATQNQGLFWATVGGLGLTGIILAMDVKLIPVHNDLIEMESIRVRDLDQFFEVSAQSGAYTHTVSWIDCTAKGAAMGRGIFMRGRHAGAEVTRSEGLLERAQRWASPMLDAGWLEPNWLLNQWTIKAFNEVYYRKQWRAVSESVVPLEPFFFPLDFVKNWNYLYGKRGFLQYQFVVPPDPSWRAVREILGAISKSGMASFLAVIKEFGEESHGGLSFPMPGPMIALDFPNYGQPLLDLMDGLDKLVADAGGRIYLGKDARLSAEMFRVMYPEWEAWKATRDQFDPQGVFQSDLGRRLGLIG
jgi:decaprenylphospho-beta-D-ribofuranose 2-oxidase